MYLKCRYLSTNTLGLSCLLPDMHTIFYNFMKQTSSFLFEQKLNHVRNDSKKTFLLDSDELLVLITCPCIHEIRLAIGI